MSPARRSSGALCGVRLVAVAAAWSILLLTPFTYAVAADPPPVSSTGTPDGLLTVGARVEADVNMSGRPEGARWRKATITRVEMWQGQVSGYQVKTEDGAELMLGAKYLRQTAAATADRAPKPAAEAPARPSREQGPGGFRQRDGGPDRERAECPFTKGYAPVPQEAPASAALFQSVIFEWQRSTQSHADFGVTFLDFKLGGTFRNAATENGRKLVDTAPIGVTVHPVKARELICRKDLSITLRTVRDIEYDCYKSSFGEWVCKNGAPKTLEHTSIPNR